MSSFDDGFGAGAGGCEVQKRVSNALVPSQDICYRYLTWTRPRFVCGVVFDSRSL